MDLRRMERELLSYVDKKSQLDREKVERYIRYQKILKTLDTELSEMGVLVVVENGSQTFTKLNPALDGILKLDNVINKLDIYFEEKRVQNSAKNDQDLDDILK